MKKRPILFSTPMVQAILEGRKTVTRRVMKPGVPIGSWEETIPHCPYGKVGDILWVREKFWSGYQLDENDHIPENAPLIHSYYADNPFPRPCDMSDSMCTHLFGHDKRDWTKWKPSIHMPYDACRLFLKITDIRIERLQAITEEQAIAEGIELYKSDERTICRDYSIKPEDNEGRNYYSRPADSFRSLWEFINGVGSWDENPFVWAVSFEKIEKPL